VTIAVSIQWTETAWKSLQKLPKSVSKGIVKKVGGLQNSDPRVAGKPLVGPLQGYRSMTHGRYRVLFHVDEERFASGDVSVRVRMLVVLAGIRREKDKKDVYQVAQKLVELGIIPSRVSED
jgi:mRNA interferase RelE/StbE